MAFSGSEWEVFRKSSKCWCSSRLHSWSNNIAATDLRMDGSVLEEKLTFKMLGLSFSSKLNWSSHVISIPKTASIKIGDLTSIQEWTK